MNTTDSTNNTMEDFSNHSVEPTPVDQSMPPQSPCTIQAFPEDQSTKKSVLSVPKRPRRCRLSSEDSLSTANSSEHTSDSDSSGRSVSFSPLVRVKDTISHRDMSLKEHYEYWLQDHEFRMIKRRNKGTIRAIEESSPNDDEEEQDDDSLEENDDSYVEHPYDDLCLRGLESCLRNENLRRRSYRYAALEEVFLEQEEQYYAGIYDDEAISEVYYEVTRECRFRAEFRAIQDRKEVEDYLLDPFPEDNDDDYDEFAL